MRSVSSFGLGVITSASIGIVSSSQRMWLPATPHFETRKVSKHESISRVRSGRKMMIVPSGLPEVDERQMRPMNAGLAGSSLPVAPAVGGGGLAAAGGGGGGGEPPQAHSAVSYTHLRAHETPEHLVC